MYATTRYRRSRWERFTRWLDDVWFPLLMAVVVVGVFVLLGFIAVGDQRAKEDCTGRGGLIVKSEHGDGWSCFNPDPGGK